MDIFSCIVKRYMEAPRCTLFFKPWYAIINANCLFFFISWLPNNQKWQQLRGQPHPLNVNHCIFNIDFLRNITESHKIRLRSSILPSSQVAEEERTLVSSLSKILISSLSIKEEIIWNLFDIVSFLFKEKKNLM